MLFKDHLKIVTDAGAVLHLGWDYDTPYFLDPLNGIDVDLKTAQGVNQVGDTVEGQSVSGMSRTLDVVFWGAYALDNARDFSKKLHYFTKGTLYFGDHYFTRFVLQKTPYFSSYTPQPRCSLMLYSEKPFWYDLNAVSSVLGGYERRSAFLSATTATSTASNGTARRQCCATRAACRCPSRPPCGATCR